MINKYNILKHLPTFELLEFKDWWQDLSKSERMGINIVFHNSTRLLRKVLLREGSNMIFRPFNEDSKYKFEIRTRSNYEVMIILQIDNSNVNKIMEYRGFEKFSEKKLQALLDCYLKEVFLYSNFEKFNNQKDLEFYSEPIKTDGHIFTINSGVRNRKEKALKIKQIVKSKYSTNNFQKN